MFKKIALPLLSWLCLSGVVHADPRIFCSATQSWVSLDQALDTLAQDDVVFVGEIHDNAACHVFEQQVLSGLFARQPDMALGLEMFERDVQPVLDGYVSGAVSDDTLQAEARPWPNYESDYRPLVDFARDHHLDVLATNVPRSLATAVSQQGMVALQQVPVHVLRLFARHTEAPQDGYYQRFVTAMGDHTGVANSPDMTRFYQAQCLKDDTMAESIADYRQQRRRLVLHVNGSFHTDYRQGTASRFQQREPDAHVAVVSVVLGAAATPTSSGAPGDFVVYLSPIESSPSPESPP